MVPPRMMCRQHLLGEHVEMHMFAGTLRKGISMKGYYDNGLVDLSKLISRHDALAAEMERRGMRHASALHLDPELRTAIESQPAHRLPVRKARAELIRRCPECAALLTRRKT